MWEKYFVLELRDPLMWILCSSDNHITGLANDNLHYYDGMISLTYTDGDPYHSTPPVARKTEITFICDKNAGHGNAAFISEGNYTYSFEWLTALACPEIPVECAITDSKTGKHYDLSG